MLQLTAMDEKPTEEKPPAPEDYRMPRDEFERVIRHVLTVPPMPQEKKPPGARPRTPKKPTKH